MIFILTYFIYFVRLSIDKINKFCQLGAMKDLDSDPKRQLILEAAWRAFGSYGFRKTSMDDIAKAAGISRPAVYLQFRSKDDIFRSLVQVYYDSTVSGVREALSGSGDPTDVLKSAFGVQAGEIMEAVLSSPHGHELLDLGTATAGDIKDRGEADLRHAYADWLADQVRAGHIHMSAAPDHVAATICASLKGLKDMGGDYATYRARVDVLAELVGSGLQTR